MKRQLLLMVASLALGMGWLLPATAATVATGNQTTTGNVQFIPNTDTTTSVDPANPDGSGKPFPGDPADPDNQGTGSRGLLTLDYLSNLKFQQKSLTNGMITATASNRQAFVQLSDRRGTGTGWSLMLKPEQLRGEQDDAKISAATVALGSAYFLSSGGNVSQRPTVMATATQALPIGSYSLIAQAQGSPGKRQGVGTWLLRLNTSASEPTQLKVLAAAVPSEQTYQGTLSWMLTDAPQ